jgi:hypothetical protein
MNLTIAPIYKDSVYTFTMQYDTQQPRKYILRVQNRKAGLWITDEQNSILLPGYFQGGHYVDLFQVNSQLLRSDYELVGNVLIIRIDSWNLNAKEITGDDIPSTKIWNFPPGSIQFGVLTRHKKNGG